MVRHSGLLKDHLELTVRTKLHYFLRPGLKEFLEFCLNNFEVMFWTTAEDRTLDPQYEELLKACPALGENRLRFGRRWCDQFTYVNLITRKQDCYLKRLNRLLMDKRCLAEYCHLKDYFLIVDLLLYWNVLINPYNAYHPTMYHRQTKSNEFDAKIPYFRHAVQPFLQGLLDSGKTVHSIVLRMTDAASADYFLGTRSTLYTGKSFLIVPKGLKLMRLQHLGVFRCLE